MAHFTLEKTNQDATEIINSKIQYWNRLKLKAMRTLESKGWNGVMLNQDAEEAGMAELAIKRTLDLQEKMNKAGCPDEWTFDVKKFQKEVAENVLRAVDEGRGITVENLADNKVYWMIQEILELVE